MFPEVRGGIAVPSATLQLFSRIVGLFLLGLCLVCPSHAQTFPENDSFNNAGVITGSVQTVVTSNIGATKEPGEPNHAGNSGGKSLWWSWTAPSTGIGFVDTWGSSFDTLVAVYTGSSVSNLTLKASNDDGLPNFLSKLNFQCAAGTTYYIAVDGFDGHSGAITLDVSTGQIPLITNQPTSRAAAPGSLTAFNVSAIGVGLKYQWCKNGVTIQGATGLSYSISNVQSNDAGIYTVVVTNSSGSMTSSNAELQVLPAFIVSQPLQVDVVAGSNAFFNVIAGGVPPLTYQWQKDGVDVVGGTYVNLTITNATSADSGIYWLIVSNSLDVAASTNIPLAVTMPYTFTTLAGSAGIPGSADGQGSAARFFAPHGIAVDHFGYVYVSDLSNSIIRRITPGGRVSTLAGKAGNKGSTNGVGTTARFNEPWGVTVDNDGSIIVADTANETIRRIARDGHVSTVAGLTGAAGSNDGPALLATFHTPSGVTAGHSGNIYVADWDNWTIRQITPLGVVTTIAGGALVGGDGFGRKAHFSEPSGVGTDSSENIIVADEQDFEIRKIDSEHNVTTLAGFPSPGSYDGRGPLARFSRPHGGVVDAQGNIYIADMGNHTVRKVTPTGGAITIAGAAGVIGSADGTGPIARFYSLRGVAVDDWGNLYVTDFGNQTIRKGWPSVGGQGPIITEQPQSQTVVAGSTNFTLTVAVGGTGLFSYQWFHNNLMVIGQTNDTLPFGPVQRGDGGSYSVVITNSFGSATSTLAEIRVLVPPLLEPPRFLANGNLQIQFRDQDTQLPDDPSTVEVQWRTNLPSGIDTNWQSLPASFYVTNGFMTLDVTIGVEPMSSFFRVIER